MFPSLETQVRIQYKSYRSSPSRHIAHYFLGEQRQATKLIDSDVKGWVLRYEALEAHEINRIRSFYESIPPLSTFSFIDPWTEIRYDRVRFVLDGMQIVQVEPDSFRLECELEQSL